ncbi:MAG TPA: ABC transporter ATP-binding protein [Verrucomicrobiae bacterium]|jgi:ABC-2 type transport system ATP-binding protein|nr:ABC transporter ATP-binding protein [Verrucomicrobiae bacterium]
MIELRHVTKKFGAGLAVDDVSLTVPPGEIFGLLGHNGAGKSTAIGMMLGQVWPTAGEVKLRGYDVTQNRRDALQAVGAIFEAPVFYNELSARRNLDILSAYTARTPARRIDEVIDWVGLTGRAQDKVRTYSHGMRARLALAQALLPQPELLILDEPGDGLDPEGIHEMRQTILRLRRELGLTILLSSHLLAEVELVCTQIAVMSRGRKVFQGSLAEARPAADWVRLRTQNFAESTRVLRAAQLITAERDGSHVRPAPEIPTDQIVACLVAGGQRVFEITREEPTLESFYLDLMKK